MNASIDLARRHFTFASFLGVAAPFLIGPGRAWSAESVVVETANGRLRGMRENDVVAFKGVPYADDTGGANRFMAPRPVRSWSGVRDALEFGSRCPQLLTNEPASEGRAPVYREDCCVLNVWTPHPDSRARRPVLLYIHGGGFRSGSGDAPFEDGANLARFGGVVVVTVNHRLNLFGYANLGHLHPDFADSGNVGQLDLIAALNWIRTNISVFGGDPQRVMLFGVSGGGSKIVTLSMMPAADGLFHRSINMSGSSAYGLVRAEEAQAFTHEWLRILGIHRGNLRRLQEMPVEQLLKAYASARQKLPAADFLPVVDGRHVLHAPMSPEGVRRQAILPAILSRTLDEASTWLASDRRNLNVTWEQLSARVQAQFGIDDARAKTVLECYLQDDPQRTPWDVLCAIASDALVRMPICRAAEARVAVGGSPTYLCDFAWKSPVDGGIWGAAHGIDVPFAFGNVDKHPLTAGAARGAATEVSRILMSAYVTFAASGSPDNRRMPPWVPYNNTTRPTMVIDESYRLIENYRAGDRRGSELLSPQEPFQLIAGPLFRPGV